MNYNEAVYEGEGKTMKQVRHIPEEKAVVLYSSWPTVMDLAESLREESERATGSRRIRIVISD